mmetsp:Transcript_45644/g.95817  ORF Transcript_45644/g.95817 Transcript_45644/m.95817 type:complete len:832 (-) Transcript_45644:172-2667(-)|eukprot:CAMPEP_0183734134 /NCGR_PEP_ID=MMETSP0737-20130205/42994_1 /TAXON_ID=385413 /ORGANISM="Thalassiosira miniscula, Strain CCMP1093" /LENGTH=831 /DNA_ID=CAMNT_0025967553 /DNA_START=114 /DNA_END=2609 /DNA_ORIENTATION=-
MVQFGKTLNEVVKSDWRCHAVAYIELKRTISHETHLTSKNNSPCEDGVDVQRGAIGTNECNDPEALTIDKNDEDDVHSVHTESPYYISENQKANYFHIYEDSIRRVTQFYESRVEWAREEVEMLESVVEKRITFDANARADSSDARENLHLAGAVESTSSLINRITDFSKDLDLILEFFELNVTAFSKIMKKFDKRTGSALREAKVRELKAEHPYLYDGGEIRQCRNKCNDWTKQLQLQSQKDKSKGRFTNPRSSSSKRSAAMRLTLNNSLMISNANGIAKLVAQNENSADGNNSENPQEDSDHRHSYLENIEEEKELRPSQSIHKTKQAYALQNMMDRISEELCLQKADSPFFDKAQGNYLPPSFSSSEVELASELGQGEFCKIYEVCQFNIPESCNICFLHRGYTDPDLSLKSVPNNESNQRTDLAHDVGESNPSTQADSKDFPSFNYGANISNYDYDDLESDHEYEDYEDPTRGFMKDHCLRNGEARYAIKRIRSDIVGLEDITDAAIDLAREAEFLAALKHPNIIRIRGTLNTPGHPKYGIILDRLYDTLEVRMEKWKVDVKRYRGKFKGLIGKNKMMLEKVLMDRLVAAYDLSHAMAHVHSCGILHRDIKPANIGFDIRGDIKIFDFGLAKELKPIDREGNDQYHTSGVAGTRRYMAPEVVQVMPYGLSSDVYSFGVLMWEMLALKSAYTKYSREAHYKEVVIGGMRPKIPKRWPFVIKNLLGRCWHNLPKERPSFQSVCEAIEMGIPDEYVTIERSNDLLLRSVRSKQGYMDMRLEDFMDSEHTDMQMNVPNESENIFSDPTDLLSRSIRSKRQHPASMRKHPHI